jgi:hypothetical protein
MKEISIVSYGEEGRVHSYCVVKNDEDEEVHVHGSGYVTSTDPNLPMLCICQLKT